MSKILAAIVGNGMLGHLFGKTRGLSRGIVGDFNGDRVCVARPK